MGKDLWRCVGSLNSMRKVTSQISWSDHCWCILAVWIHSCMNVDKTAAPVVWLWSYALIYDLKRNMSIFCMLLIIRSRSFFFLKNETKPIQAVAVIPDEQTHVTMSPESLINTASNQHQPLALKLWLPLERKSFWSSELLGKLWNDSHSYLFAQVCCRMYWPCGNVCGGRRYLAELPLVSLSPWLFYSFIRVLFFHSYDFFHILNLILTFPTIQSNSKALEYLKRFKNLKICVPFYVWIQ